MNLNDFIFEGKTFSKTIPLKKATRQLPSENFAYSFYKRRKFPETWLTKKENPQRIFLLSESVSWNTRQGNFLH